MRWGKNPDAEELDDHILLVAAGSAIAPLLAC
jgi:ferredoxin-NADP reductase